MTDRHRGTGSGVLGLALGVAMLVWLGNHLSLAWAGDELFVANDDVVTSINSSVTVYARTASGNAAPLRPLSGVATGLSGPVGLVLDLVNNELVVANSRNNSVTVYARTASGNAAPLRTLQGSATGLVFPEGFAVDPANNELLVANGTNNSVTVYARTASGNAAPLRTLQGSATGLTSPRGLAVDTANNELVVANANSIAVYARTASGNAAPLRILSGVATGLNGPQFLAVATTSAATEGFVTRLYQRALTRAPEPGGVAAWVQKIQQDGTVVPTVLAFFHSAEFLSHNTSDVQFLTILFRMLLNREPDPAGFNAFLSGLQAGQLTRDNLLDVFIDSREFADLTNFLQPLSRLAEFVTTLYVRVLGRGPDRPGLQSFLASLQQTCTTATVLATIRTFLASPEFLARQTTNTEFVTLLFRVFLDRLPDPASLASFVALLNQGTATRDQLVTQFAASPEFQGKLQALCS